MSFKKTKWFGAFSLSIMGAALAGCAVPLTKEVVSTTDAPAAIGPYSQAIKVGNTIYVSGQIPLDPKSGQLVSGSIEDQTKQVLDNVRSILASQGAGMAEVVTTTVYLKDLNDFSRMNAVYGTYFGTTPPARATVQVARLPRDVAIEISVTAIK